jgi:BTB/POZ domain-containing protein 9
MIDSVETELTLSSDLALLLKSEEFSDIQFEVEGTVVNAHRNVLIARSDYFRAMLCENLKADRLAKPIHMEGISLAGFRALLHYFYTGNIDPETVNVEIACELKRISDWYDLDDLNAKSFLFVQSQMSVDNVIGLFVSAHTLSPRLDDVEEVTLRFIAKNFNSLLDRPEFKKLPQSILITITQFYAQFHK